MAKKRRLVKEEPEEEYEFKPSEFDEREFIISQMRSTKVLFIAIAIAIAVGVLNAFISKSMDRSTTATVIDTVIVFFVAVMMKKFLIAIGIKEDLLETRAMLGNVLVYLIMALGVCIFALNVMF